MWSNITSKKILNWNFIFDLILLYKFPHLIRYCIAIKKAENKLKNFKNLEKIFIGDEYNFPIIISIAAKILNIEIVAYQRRINTTANKNQIIVDKYFVLGEKTKKDLKFQIYKNIQIFIVGNYQLAKTPIIEKFDASNKKISIIAFDHATNSLNDWYKYCINPIFNHYTHNNFLNIIIKLSKKFPEVLFTIKSKHTGWLHDEYYSSTLNNLNQSKNISLYNNIDFCKNLDLIEKFDIAIGLQTSALDDFLSYGKPVLIFDNKNFFIKNIEYGEKMYSNNYQDFENKTNFLINNYKSAIEDQNETRNLFFNNFNKNNFELLFDKHIF